MSTQEPGTPPAEPLTSLPRIEDVPKTADDGYDPDAVREAFDAFRRHTAQLQAQLRVMQAAGRSAKVEPTGHAVRMDALHLIRAAAEFADELERDAQNASAAQLAATEEEIRAPPGRAAAARGRGRALPRRSRSASATRSSTPPANEARELLANAERDATRSSRGRGARQPGCSSRPATRRPSSRTPPAPRSSRRSSGRAHRRTRS